MTEPTQQYKDWLSRELGAIREGIGDVRATMAAVEEQLKAMYNAQDRTDRRIERHDSELRELQSAKERCDRVEERSIQNEVAIRDLQAWKIASQAAWTGPAKMASIIATAATIGATIMFFLRGIGG